MKKGAVYARKSLRGETDESINRQVEETSHRLRARGCDSVDVLIEKKGQRSGRSEKNRPVWMELKAKLLRGEYQMFGVQDIFRVYRNAELLLPFIRDLTDKGVEFFSVKENIDPKTPDGRLMIGFLALLGQWYAERISDDQKFAIKSRVASGGTWGKIPLGLLRNKKKQYEPSDEGYVVKGKKRTYLATVIRWMEMYSTGDIGVQDGAMRLGLEGFKWARTFREYDENGDAKTIKEPAGVNDHHLTWTVKILESYRGCVPNELLNQCLRVKKLRARRYSNTRKRETPPPLLWRVLTCAECRKRYVTSAGNKTYQVKSGEKKRTAFMRYTHRGMLCSQVKRQRTFMSQVIDEEAMEIIVGWAIEQIESHKETIARKMSAPTEPAPEIDDAEIDRRLTRLNKLYVTGNMTDLAYAEERAALELLRPKQTLPSSLPTYEEALKSLEELPAIIKHTFQSDPTTANLFFRLMMEEVDITDGEIVGFYPVESWIPLFEGHPLMLRRGQI